MRNVVGFGHPVIGYLEAVLRIRVERARSEETDRGASAIEWVIIAAIAVGIVAAVGVVIMGALKSKATDIEKCIKGVSFEADC